MNYEEIQSKVIATIAEKTGINQAVINPQTELTNFCFDDFDMMELEVSLEKEFKVPVSISEDFLPCTVLDIAAHISKKMSNSPKRLIN